MGARSTYLDLESYVYGAEAPQCPEVRVTLENRTLRMSKCKEPLGRRGGLAADFR